jgi:hypothetical protein
LNAPQSPTTFGGTLAFPEGLVSRLDVFVAPKPNPALIRLMAGVNRVFMLRGIPVFRDVNPFNRLAGLRGIANVRHIDFPRADRDRLAAVCGPGKATFVTPNHPEFFTDWMLDKEIMSGISPLAAYWATHGVVNGLGALMQKFWLANNLIAQIPGNSDAAREHSVQWALGGHGVLLHPEGGVGWHGDFVAPLLPGAVEMGFEALARGRAADPAFQAWVAPVVWKLAFLKDVEPELAAECAYVERCLKIARDPVDSLPERVHRIYSVLLARDEAAAGLDANAANAFAARQEKLVAALASRLGECIGSGESDVSDLLRQARRWMRENTHEADRQKEVRKLTETIHRVRRVGPWAWAEAAISQENIAEHLKRIRNDYCKGSWRDAANRFVPQPAGPRRAHVRVPEPIALHAFDGSADEALGLLRHRMQAAIKDLQAEVVTDRIVYPNPFRRRL